MFEINRWLIRMHPRHITTRTWVWSLTWKHKHGYEHSHKSTNMGMKNHMITMRRRNYIHNSHTLSDRMQNFQDVFSSVGRNSPSSFGSLKTKYNPHLIRLCLVQNPEPESQSRKYNSQVQPSWAQNRRIKVDITSVAECPSTSRKFDPLKSL